MIQLRSLFRVLVCGVLLFCNHISISADGVAADGYYHDIIKKANFPSLHASCIDIDCSGQLANYHLYIGGANELLSFETHQAKLVGLITTASKGRIASVKLGCSYYGGMEGERCFYIYGKNTPYSSTNDLIDSKKQGELIATIDRADDTANFNVKTFTGEKQYKYIGICANTGLYLEYADIAWKKDDYNRPEVPAQSLGTICLPYAVKADGICGVKVFELAGKVTEGDVVDRIVFSEVQEMEAGMPYFYYFPSEENGTLTLTLSEGIVDEPKSKNGLHGTFVDLPFTDLDAAKQGDAFIVNNIGALQRATTESGVRANRAYVVMSEVSEYSPLTFSGSRLIVSGDGFSIDDRLTSVKVGELTPSNVIEVYSIHGGKVQRPTAGQTILISNGRKFITR